MKEASGNIFDWMGKVEVMFVTTNMEFNEDGSAVMGAGMALQVAKRYAANIPLTLGVQNMRGNQLPAPLWKNHHAVGRTTEIWSFPVKAEGRVLQSESDIRAYVLPRYRGRYRVGDYLPSWAHVASTEMIVACAQAAQGMPHKSFVLPRPGCGFGGLLWDDVGPVLHEILDDRFTAVTY